MLKSTFHSILKTLLSWEVILYRSRYRGPIIAITGSLGKTGTKEAVGHMVRKKYGTHCLVTPGNLNTEIGVPLSLFGYTAIPHNFWGWLLVPFRGLMVALFAPLPQCLVLEFGAEHKGDIAHLARIIRPTCAIITAITQAHTETTIGSIGEVQKEKTALLHFLPLDGIAILNGDDEYLRNYQLSGGQEKILVRLYERADYFASGVKVNLAGTEAILHHNNRTQRLRIKRYGEQHMYATLFAAAIGDIFSISPTLQLEAFKSIHPIPGRGMLLEGKNGSHILDESYNASPLAMMAALEVLHQLPAHTRVAILGDMRELKESEKAHKEISQKMHKVADYSIAVGPLSRAYKADEWFLTSEEAIPSALRQAHKGVIILVKGSQNTIRLEKVVKALLLHPNQADKVLVRQGKEWETRT